MLEGYNVVGIRGSKSKDISYNQYKEMVVSRSNYNVIQL